MKSLPRSLEGVRGLRAARWVRESTRGQFDNAGPDSQREQQDRAMERYGLQDTGIEWQVAHSGRTIGTTSQFAEMVSRAGRDYDVLLVGYVSRFSRNLRTAVNARHDLHSAGAAILFADERVLSSDEDAWEQWARETVEAESYSRKLGRRIREGYASRFRRLSDPAGRPPPGFRREGRALVLAVDPATIRQPVRIFERYATGLVSLLDLAASEGLSPDVVRHILRNPIYNGWTGRYRGAERQPAPWRADPPVSDALWEQVTEMRERRRRGGRRTGPARTDLLRGLVYCVCGTRIRANGMTDGVRRRIHPGKCPEWGDRYSVRAEAWEEPIAAQLSSLRLTDATLARVVRVLAEEPPSDTTKTRLERQKRDLALDHVAGRLTDEQYLARLSVLRATANQEAPPRVVPAARAVEYLRDFAELWRRANDDERTELVHSVYSRIVVRGPSFAEVKLTPSAEAHGFVLVMPETVKPRDSDYRVPRYHRIPVAGRRDWLAAARSA